MVRNAAGTFVGAPTQRRGVEPAPAHGVALRAETKRAITVAVARELHKLNGGNEVLDWLEAEILVEGVLENLDRS